MDNSTKDKFEHYLSQIVINKSYNEKLLINQIISLIKKWLENVNKLGNKVLYIFDFIKV